MNGFYLSFFTLEDRRHRHKPVHEWLLDEAKKFGIGGATVIRGLEGYGHHRKLHSYRFFELQGDQPIEVAMAASADEAERFIAHVAAEGLRLFYIKTPVEYGMTGDGLPAQHAA